MVSQKTGWRESNGQKFDKWVDKKFSEGKPDEFFKTFSELSKDAGFQSECYQTETEDGYILNMFRVKDSATPSDAPVVFLQHGLMCSADSWAVNGN